MADTEIEGSDLAAIIADEIRLAQTFDQSKREAAIEYMRGEMNDLPARTNGSSQTSRDVADVVSWMLPSILRVFTASDQMVQFQATQAEGEEAAEEASEYTNYSFFRENDGYLILRNATYDALQGGNGAACSYWCPEKSKTKRFPDKTLEELALLLQEGWEGLGVAPQQTGTDPETGEPLYTVRLKQVSERGYIADLTLKPENLEISGNVTTIEDARYAGYVHDELTRSDLLEMADTYGWDKAVIEEFPRYSLPSTNQATQARQNTSTNSFSSSQSSTLKSGDDLRAREVYIHADRDGDGIAELLRVWCLGEGSITILSADEWDDDVPFTDIPCYPVAHQWQAEGVYDREADVQRVKTVVLRNFLDNIYSVGLPMREVEAGSVVNPDILVNPKFGGLIWKTKQSAPIINHDTAFIGDKLMMALEYMDQVTAKRTGVSKTTMALDPETLQNQSATANQNEHDAGYSQIELVARDMAELGWAKFFSKRRNLAKKYIKGQLSIPSRNGDAPQMDGQPAPKPTGYRTIQPEQWSDDMACTINVGLGTGSRDRDMQMLNLIQNGQVGMAERLSALPSPTARKKAIEFIPKIRKTAVEMAESSGLKNPDDYYPDISEQELQAIEGEMQQAAQQGDPKVALEQQKAQADIQLQGQKQQADQNMQAQKLQNDAMAQQQDFQLKQAQLAQELQLKRDQLAAELQLKREQMTAELALQRELGHAKVKAQANVTSDVHPGGQPG